MIRKTLALLRPYLWRYRGYLIAGIGAVLLHNVFRLVTPMVLRSAVDALRESAPLETIWLYAGAVVGLTAIGGVFLFFMRRTVIWASRKMEFDLRGDLFKHLLTLSPSYFDKTPTGEILSRASADIEAVRMLVGPGVMYTINTVIVTVGAIPFMFYLDWHLALYTLLPLPLLSIAVHRIGKIIHHRFRAIQEHFAVLSAHVQESLAGIRVVKAGAHEHTRFDEFRELNQRYYDLNWDLIKMQGFFRPFLMFLAGGAVVAVLFFGGRSVIAGDISLGTFVAFTVYLALLIWPMIALGWVVSLYQRGTASLNRLTQIFEATSDVADVGLLKSPGSIGSDINITNLSFSYPGTDRHVLKDLSLEIAAGETLAIIGPTGSGKTTLLRLLSRSYPVPDNSIRIGGQDINQIPLDELRRMFGVVAQESFLFSTTLTENVSFGRDSLLEQSRLNELSRLAGIADEIEEFPQQWQTMLGERGITLSGGQKQRVALARALAVEPPILLLDDAFSAVDTQTEEDILTHFAAQVADRTVLLVTHRISTARRADRIAVLDQGIVAEIGTHERLMAGAGLYATLAEKQALREQLEAI